MWFFFTMLPGLLGILRYRFWAYWKWVLILQVWQLVGTLLFSAGGTLRDLTSDGLITHYVRVTSNDGPAVALIGIVFLVVFYGGVLWFIQRMYKAARENKNSAAELSGATVPRKAAEVALLTAAVSGLLYWQFADRFAERARTLPPTAQVAQTAPVDPVAEQLKTVAAEVSSKGPQKLDSITTLSRATAEGRTLIYHYAMSRRDGSDDALRAFFSRNTLPKVCGNSDMRSAIDDYGVVYRYSYTFPNSQAPVTIDVTSQACRS